MTLEELALLFEEKRLKKQAVLLKSRFGAKYLHTLARQPDKLKEILGDKYSVFEHTCNEVKHHFSEDEIIFTVFRKKKATLWSKKSANQAA